MSAHAINRLQQGRDIVMRPVTDDGLTSYIGTFVVNDQEQLTFEVRVRPQGWEERRNVEFQRRFILD